MEDDMRIFWSIPFPEEMPEETRQRIVSKTEAGWRRMLSAFPDAEIVLAVGSEWDPQDPVFEGLPGNRAEQAKWRKRLLQAAQEVAQAFSVPSAGATPEATDLE
jgi:hypothetical protein